jgi:predicted transcriptional regulator
VQNGDRTAAVKAGTKMMRIALDEDLIAEVDRAASLLKMTRVAFVRQALANAITRQDEAQHRRGHEAAPERHDEFSRWVSEQVGRNEAIGILTFEIAKPRLTGHAQDILHV